MKAAAQLLETLRRINNTGDEVFPAVVKSVEDDNTCTVLAADETEYFDVRLQSLTGGSFGVVITPTVGSVVLVQRIGKSSEFTICMFSQVDEVKTVIGTNSVTHDATGIELKGGVDSLGKVIGDLLTAIQVITVNVTAVGAPTGVPINGATFATLKTRLDAFIK